MRYIFKLLPVLLMGAMLPFMAMAQQDTPHTIQALETTSLNFQNNLKAGVAAYQKKDYTAACTSFALAVGDGKTLRWHSQGLVDQQKALNQDTSEIEAQITELDSVLTRLEARTKDICAMAQ